MSAFIEHNLWGKSEFKSHINPSQLMFVHPPPILPPPTFNLTTLICPQPPATTRQVAPPLSWGMWAQIYTPQHTRKADPSHPPLPPPEECGRLKLTRWRNRGGRNISGDPRSGGPIWCVSTTNHDENHGLFSSFHRPFHPTDLSTQCQHDDPRQDEESPTPA